MAVPAGPTEARYVGNGVTTVFTIPFLLIIPTDLEVWLNGVEQSSGYVVTGAGNPTSTLTFLAPPAVGADIYIALDVPFERLNDYQENGDFLATTVNRDYDRIWQALKQLLRFSTRSPQLGKFDVDGKGWYRAKGNGLRDLADPQLDQDAVNFRFVRNLIEQAVAGVVGGFGWFVQAGAGAIQRTFQSKMRDTVSVMDFGAIGGPVAVYHPLSERFATLAAAQTQYPFVTSLTQSIDWAATQAAVNTGKLVYAPGNKYVMTDRVIIPSGGGIVGDGAPMWTGGFSQFVDDANGTHFIPYGTFAKEFSLKHISKCANSGGVWANPSAAEPHYAASNSPTPFYELHDFTNQNAVGATPATVKPFSAMFVTADRGNVTLRDFRVVPYFNGQEGYKSIYETGLGANCDVALFMLNSENSNVSNVQVVGYWRAQGILKVSQTPIGDDGNSERDNFYHCKIQGHTGFSVRGNDLHRCVAVTATTVAIKWYASHTFEPTGTLRIASQNRPYTSFSYDSVNDWLVFAIANTAGVAVGANVVVANGNFGSSGTQVRDCTIYDLYHNSRMVSNNTLLGFSVPGKCVEISGEPARAVQFWGCTIQGRDDIMVQQLHSRDSEWYGCYFEAQPAFGTVFDGTYNYTLPAGSRHIAVSEGNTIAPFPAGSTTNLRMYGCTPQTSSTIDLRPSSPITKPARFSAAGDNGLFLPREVYDDRYALVMNGQNVRYQSVDRIRLRPESYVELGGNGQAEQYLHSLGASLVLSSGTRIRISTGTPGAQTENYTLDANRIVPVAAGKDLGNTFAANTFARSFVTRRYWTATLWDGFGPGSPEGVETASIGSTYRSTTTGKTWTKTSGAGNTGWV